VAGLAALVRERFPDLTARQVADRIIATARRPACGRDDRLGHGVIDPVGALTAVPAVLEPAAERPTERSVAPLPGTAPHPAVPEPASPPFDLAAACLLLAAGAMAAVLLRSRPRRTR
jgi:membrane-anchored mycosin MYCP